MEDDGTPPASDGGLLAASAGDGGPFGAAGSLGYAGAERRAIRKAPSAGRAARKAWRKLLLLPAEGGDESGVDLVRLLDENWFWRSNTASPSMADLSPARHAGGGYASQLSGSSGSRASAGTSSSASPFAERAARSRPEAASTSGSGGSPQERGQGPPLLSRRSRSEGMDSLAGAEGEGEPRAHSYAHRADIQRRAGGGSQAPAQPDPTEGDPLGTWAQRVFRFMPERRPSAPTHIPGTPDVSDLPPRQPGRQQPGRSQAQQQQRQQQRQQRPPAVEEGDEAASEAASEERAVQAAWRWRFNRRWRTEQAKQFDPEFGLDGDDDDGWDTALGYLDACGPGFHLQVARTTSIDKGLTATSLRSEVSDDVGLLLDESQPEKAPLQEQAEAEGTRSIVSVAKKARDLYRQQQRIERDVQTRWGDAKVSMSWAGQHLAAVRVDSYGCFPFVLLKVSDRTQAHRLLVRGRNGASVAELVAAATAEVRQLCAEKQLAAVSLGLLGAGTMEWSRERDHRVNVCAGRVERGCDPSIQTADDIVRLAGALTRASLPAPNRVTVNGEKLS